MRRLSLVLLAALIPAATLSAQLRVPLRRGTPPDREKPKQAPGIHDARLYNRYAFSRFSLESTPMLAYMQTTGVIAQGFSERYVSFGDATLLSFRAAPSFFVTTAFTSSSVGSPFGMNASEFGFRIKPWVAPRVAVFADARASWAFTSSFPMPSSAIPFAAMYMNAYNDFSTGRGSGMLLGLGAETRISSRYAISTSLSHTRYAMKGYNLSGSNSSWKYTNDATRLMVGLRYNHGRWLDAP